MQLVFCAFKFFVLQHACNKNQVFSWQCPHVTFYCFWKPRTSCNLLETEFKLWNGEEKIHWDIWFRFRLVFKISLVCVSLYWILLVLSFLSSFSASGNFWRLLITFANSLDPGQARHAVGPDLAPNYLIVWWYSLNNFLKKLILKKISRQQKSMQNYTQHAKSLSCCLVRQEKWASMKLLVNYQNSLRPACANAHSSQSLHCLHST